MSKILLSTLPVLGHILPAISAARKLQEAGHEVVFVLSDDALEKVPFEIPRQSTGQGKFTYKPVNPPRSFKELITFLSRLEANARYVLVDWTISELSAMRTIVANQKPDLIVSDCLYLTPLLVARENRIPSAVLGVTPFRGLISGSAPLRTGLPPANNWAIREIWGLFNRAIQWRFRRVTDEAMSRIAANSPSVGGRFAREVDSVFNLSLSMCDSYLQCSVPALEDRPILLAQHGVRFVGPMNGSKLSPSDHVSWQSNSNSDLRREVFVTWGTMQDAGPPRNLIAAIRTLAKEDQLKIVVAAPRDHLEIVERALASEIAGARVRVTQSFDDFVPQLKRADVFLSNGGFGAVKMALSLGVPVVCSGGQDDKPDVCGRVNRSGAGIGLQWFSTGRGIARSVIRVLATHRFRARAAEVGWALHGYETSGTLLKELEYLIQTHAHGDSQSLA